MIVVIRAGGSGTRLWPVSRISQPKQFLPLLGTKTLLEEKIREIRPLLRRWDECYLSVAESFVPLARTLAPRIPRQNIIAEPISRNTGPAIALESAIIDAAARGKDDPVIVSLTVDDVFRKPKTFRNALRASETFLHRRPQWIVALAARPPHPDTGLSYIVCGDTIATHRRQRFCVNRRWIEKPPARRLHTLLRSPRVFAHTGLYAWKASTILSHFEHYQPKMFRVVQRIRAAAGTRRFAAVLRRIYRMLPSMSIEEAVARNVKRVAIAPNDFEWSDTGKWMLVQKLLAPAGGNVTRGTVVSVDDEGCLIYGPPKKIIGTIGLRDMIIVDAGDALLVCPAHRSGDIKALLERMRERNLEQILQ
jgi:mannose-1-phosphate guanylyltransferase